MTVKSVETIRAKIMQNDLFEELKIRLSLIRSGWLVVSRLESLRNVTMGIHYLPFHLTFVATMANSKSVKS